MKSYKFARIDFLNITISIINSTEQLKLLLESFRNLHPRNLDSLYPIHHFAVSAAISSQESKIRARG